MLHNYLFLDVDGVLNIIGTSYSTHKHLLYLAEPHLVHRLNYLCDKVPDIKIVISSSWHSDMEDLQRTLKNTGFLHWEKVVGRTEAQSKSMPVSRGVQIQNYLNDTIGGNLFIHDISGKFVIFDDDSEAIGTSFGSNYKRIDQV